MTTIVEIQKLVAERLDVSIAQLKSGNRAQSICQARMIAMYLCRRLTSASYPEIGLAFGGRDHSTAIHACQRILVHQCEQVRTVAAELLAQLGGTGEPTNITPARPHRWNAAHPRGPVVSTVAAVLTAVCAHFGVGPERLAVTKPNAQTHHIRAIAIFVAYQTTGEGYDAIGAGLGLSHMSRTAIAQAAHKTKWAATAEAHADIAAIRARLQLQ